MATGELLPSADANAPRRGPEVIFNNTIPDRYYAWPGYGGPNQEWVDEGGLKDRNACLDEQVNGFDFNYCSSLADATGTSGVIEIAFYDDFIVCGGPPGWPASQCSYVLSGLPLGTPSGVIQCWTVAVDLSGGFECPATLRSSFRTEGSAPHGLFGWGFIPYQDETGPLLRRGGYNSQCCFEWFDRNNRLHLGCFCVGCIPPESFGMRLYGPRANARRYVSDDPAWPRPLDTLSLDAQTAVAAAQPATWQVVNALAGRSYWLGFATAPADKSVAAGRATLLVDPAVLMRSVHMPGGVLTGMLPVAPPSALFLQARESSAGAVTGVSNGLRHCF
ncbi:MAG: hypothetical protein EYC70_08610 [Planctomycetota bacterium]|nr:MAG: hypothetical protein EYC70_08610 [Planctomycetota bacterium]